MGKTFNDTIFNDIFMAEISNDSSQSNIINTMNKINYLYKNVYKNESNLKQAVLNFGNFLYSTLPNLSIIYCQFDIIQKYLYYIKIEEKNFLLILETLNKKEKKEVYSLADIIININNNVTLDFIIDKKPNEIKILKNMNEEERKTMYDVICSYITLLLRKEKCIMSIIIEDGIKNIIIGVLIQNGIWLPVKKDYMMIMHTNALKKAGIKCSSNIKYAEIKKTQQRK